MKLSEINIRDPFILAWEQMYYLVGTRVQTCWGKADGFDGYTSKNLEDWDGPYEIFHKPEHFWADQNYWAPEIHFYKNDFYLFATFGSSVEHRKGTMILRSNKPLGPYIIHSEGTITPKEWNCLDGTFYQSLSGIPYMIFSHEWTDIGDGEICSVELSSDLRRPVSPVRTLFQASKAKPWVRSIHNKQYPGEIYVTDGPFLYRKNRQELLLLWASFGEKGYVESIARSDNGEITGNWNIDVEPLFADNGGHGMVFTSFNGESFLTLHQPNKTPYEHPILIPVHL